MLAGGWLWMDYRQYLASSLPLPDDKPLVFQIKPGASFHSVVNKLVEQGVIDKPRYILFDARLGGNTTRIHVGEYRIQPGMTVSEFLAMLYRGDVIQYSLTLVEGWNFDQMLAAIQAVPQLDHRLAGLSDTAIMETIGHPGEHPEGRFMPDTYRYTRGMSDIEILKRAYTAMADYLNEQWEQRAEGLPYDVPYDALIMASIVEKETGVAAERQTIAGVFILRLQKGMRLQTDPTVIYGMGEAYDGNIRRRDLQRDTPYNTYTRSGLPPTPIAMPGRDAIHASLHPDNTGYLYFVSRGDGSHHFSKTLEEHNQAVIKYQLKGRKRSFSSYKADEEKDQ
ncbi:MAG: endolytic transglycosylase MltG [Thiohalophilus sp.]